MSAETEPATSPDTATPGAGATEAAEAAAADVRRGTIYGFAAYAVWGVFPLYFHALIPAGALEILAHRILWTLVVCLVVLTVRRDLGFLRGLARQGRLLAGVSVAAVLIAVNWVVYVFAVVHDNVVDASLGYFLNPLVTVALGVVVLRERLRPLQWVAVGVGLVAGVYLSIAGGHVPWISIILALSFASYGLAKNRLGASLPAVHSLTAETVVLAPIALVVVVVLGLTGGQTFTHDGPWHPALLVFGGAVTALPLILFAAAARRVPLVTIGLLQFITPILQLLCGVVLLDEHLTTARWVGFGIVWVALALLTVDSLLARPRRRRDPVGVPQVEPLN